MSHARAPRHTSSRTGAPGRGRGGDGSARARSQQKDIPGGIERRRLLSRRSSRQLQVDTWAWAMRGRGVPRVLPWERGDLRAGDTPGRPAEGQAAERHGGPRLCRGERPTPSAWPQRCREQRDPSGPRWWGCHGHFRAGQGLTEECAERRAACRRPEVPSPGTPTLCRP